ncbi:MAG: ABC transporter substrate-binding protein/permease [Akkermansia sp.]|nr:ABC transporter substrate-binding protein/permease [Akkermansia sp.]
MRMQNKWGIILLVLLPLLFCLSGCKEEREPELVMATDATFPPYEYFKGEEIVGVDVDVVAELARRNGMGARVENMKFESVIAAVQAGKVDIAAAGITVSADREKQVNFTRPYARAQQVIIVPADSSITEAALLPGMRIGVQSGTTGDLYVAENMGEPERFANGALAVAALVAGKVDAVVLDNLPAEKHVARNAALRILPTPLTEEEYAIAVNKNRPELLAMLNKTLEEMEQDGTLARIARMHADSPSTAAATPAAEQGMWASFHTNFIKNDRWKYLANGLLVTVEISAAAALIGILLGGMIGMIRSTADQTGRLKLLDALCRLYLTVIRGTPVVVQLLIIYFVIFGSVEVNKVLVAIVAFGLNSAAYVAEIIRSGIMSVDKGQMEAGRSLGLGYGYTMRSIILPQAFKNVLPALGNEFIVLLKETSICGYIALQDLTKGGDIILSQTYDAFLPLLAVALIYLSMVVVLSHLLKKLEKYLQKNER